MNSRAIRDWQGGGAFYLRSKKLALEKIGVTARTTKTAVQRAAPKKAAATCAAKKSA